MEVKVRYNKKYEKKNAAGQTTQSQLYSYLDRCCDILRGPINQDEFKVYITPLLFYKRLSDVYDERHDELLAVSDGDEEFASFDFNYDFRIPKGCHWKDVRAVSEDVGSAIIHSLMEIERANPNSLTGLFTSFDEADWTDKNKFSDERLKNLVEHMSSLNLGNKAYDADVMGDAYEYMIKKFADLSKKTAGEFYTPRAVVKLLVKILDPKPGETVYDPACGTGGMLIEAIRHINNDVETYRRIYGQEKNLINSAIASMNLYLHGAKEFIIRKGDTLRSPLFVKDGKLQRFDCVIANPPFSLKKWGAEEFASDKYRRNIWGCPQDTNGDYAWVQHMVSSMDEKTGRLCVILSQGALSRGNREGEIRRKMIESDKVECVIALKDHLFYGSGIPAAVYVLNNNKPASHKGKICFIDASGIYTPQRAQNILSDEDVEAIYGHFVAYKDVIDVVKVATLKEVAEKDFTLSVNRYVERTAEEVISPEEARAEFYAAMEDVFAAEDKLKKLLREGGYLNE
ncbi:MAG TPA: class I SAM-dependent DNA methyltransferase [Methanocorpusculum sp.]|nr:class I SAM-dependent DNA methyltransferase [Methanocorpusculum sp.]